MNRTTAVRGMLACAAALAGWAAPAIAETNVTLYGRVATGVDYISNVAKSDGGTGALWRGAGNQWGTSMFGFKGSEDLGGGCRRSSGWNRASTPPRAAPTATRSSTVAPMPACRARPGAR